MKTCYEDPEFRLEIYLELLERYSQDTWMNFLCHPLKDISSDLKLIELVEIVEQANKSYSVFFMPWNFSKNGLDDKNTTSWRLNRIKWRLNRIKVLNRAINNVTRTIILNQIKENGRK